MHYIFGGDIMVECNVAVPSYTYAIKADRILKAYGFKSEIKRRERTASTGCGYYLHISHDCSKALEILRKNSIPINLLPGGG
jgi:hypothetical protein